MKIRQIVVGHMKVFCYIVSCERTGEAIVIDPGGEVEKLLRVIQDEKLKIRFIVNSHNHPDHTWGNGAIKKATKGRLIMHRADQSLLSDNERVRYFERLNFPVSDTPLPDKYVEDGDKIDFGQCSLMVIHTPGHSPGGICLLGKGNLFTGDSLFVGAAGRVDLPGADFNTLITSLEKSIAPLPDDTIVWPGHDYGDTTTSTIGREKKENPYLGGEW